MLTGPFEDTLFDMKAGEVRGPVKTDFGYHIIRLAEVRPGNVQPLDAVRDKVAEQIRNQRADSAFYDESNKLADEAFDAYDQLETVARDLDLQLKTAERFPRSGDPAIFMDSAPVVDAIFGNEALETGINSGLVKLSDNDVVVLNVKERFPPEQKPLDAVKDEIRETLVQQRASSLAADAAAAFAAALPQEVTREFLGVGEGSGEQAAEAKAGSETGADAKGDAKADAKAGDEKAAEGKAGSEKASDEKAKGAKANDTKANGEKASTDAKADSSAGSAADASISRVAALAAQHGGTWIAPKWVERSGTDVPGQILAAAFARARPQDDAIEHDSVRLATGDQAVLFLTGVKLGDPETLTDGERNQARQEMAQSVGGAELGAYVTTVRDQAKVRVPDQVLEPQQP
jgi:hypothetical protein